MPHSPRDLILQGTWHHALFTTYSLSLSFFESQLWRGALKKRGCREAWVIADLDGYSESLGERQFRFVGNEYRLVPVALPHGVFHPKCAFLSGPEGALLMVGSGNLTFGGHGRNIEVLEVFRSADHPAIFVEFADFLAAHYFAGTTTSPELWSTPPRVPPAFGAFIPEGAELLAGVAKIRAAKTRRQEIDELRRFASMTPTAPPPDSLSICLHGDGKEAYRRLTSRHRVEFRELLPGRSACPGCHMSLPPALIETLRRQRLVLCANCDRFVFDMSPRS